MNKFLSINWLSKIMSTSLPEALLILCLPSPWIRLLKRYAFLNMCHWILLPAPVRESFTFKRQALDWLLFACIIQESYRIDASSLQGPMRYCPFSRLESKGHVPLLPTEAQQISNKFIIWLIVGFRLRWNANGKRGFMTLEYILWLFPVLGALTCFEFLATVAG
jgi:hypothetical protein